MNSDYEIHPTAVVAPGTEIGKGVSIGPYTIIGDNVKIGEGTKIGPHVVIDKNSTIGKQCQIFQFASIGADPQDLTYGGEDTFLEIGNNTIIRECVTIHRGTAKGGGKTIIGSECMIMAYCHIAHDCIIGNKVIMANGATLGGHVEIGDGAVIGGLCAIHQFCRIGRYAFMGGMSGTNKDIPPFVKYQGIRSNLSGINVLGLRRARFPKKTIDAIKDAYRIIFVKAETITEGLDQADEAFPDVPEVHELTNFIRAAKSRGVPAGEWKETT